MDIINRIDESFDINKTNDYHLSIRVTPDGFSFSVLDLPAQKYIFLHYEEFKNPGSDSLICNELTHAIENNPVLKSSYQSSALTYASCKSTLVPAPLFNENEMERFFRFNHEQKNSETINSRFIKIADAYSVFSIPLCIKEIAKNYFKKSTVIHHSPVLIENILSQNKNRIEGIKVYTHVHECFFEILVISREGLILYNCHRFTNENDFVYHLVNTFEQTRLNADTTEVIISGLMEKASKKHMLLKKYIKKVHFEELPAKYRYAYSIKELPHHFFISLFNIHSCAL